MCVVQPCRSKFNSSIFVASMHRLLWTNTQWKMWVNVLAWSANQAVWFSPQLISLMVSGKCCCSRVHNLTWPLQFWEKQVHVGHVADGSARSTVLLSETDGNCGTRHQNFYCLRWQSACTLCNASNPHQTAQRTSCLTCDAQCENKSAEMFFSEVKTLCT